MANPRLMTVNLVDQSAAITPSSEDAVLIADNVANALRKKVWRTGISTALEDIVIDHGSAKGIRAVVLLDHDLTASDTLIKIQGNATDSWGAPSFDLNLTWYAGPIVAFFPVETYRYTRITFTKSASNETRDIGRIFLGDYFEGPPASSIVINKIDLTRSTETIGGQHYSDIRDNYDDISVPMSLITKSEMDIMELMLDSVGTHTPFFISIDNDVNPSKWMYYIKNKKLPGYNTVNTTNYWSTALALREML